MSYQVFARKYRPRTFDDVLGQDHVVQTLKNAIAQNRLAHAYLFVGPRGTGKTSTARILAKALNCTGGPKVDFDPDEDICVEIAEGRSLDVLEIDGASNNGVEQVRDLRDNVKFAPSRGQFKIYYIDEVHMLSNAAFNALLKTLEEPPEHVKFVFATTEANKILPTIISRCQRFDLRRIPSNIIADHLQFIAKEEGITLDPMAAHTIAKGAEGGMRDAQSMLDQLVAFCGNEIRESDVLDVFGFTAHETVAALAGAILEHNPVSALEAVWEQSENGKDLAKLMADLIGHFRTLLVHGVDPANALADTPPEIADTFAAQSRMVSTEKLIGLIDQLAVIDGRMKWAPNKRLHFEIGVIKAVQELESASLSDVIGTLHGALEGAPAQARVAAPSPAPKAAPPMNKAPAATPQPAEPASEATTSSPEPAVSDPDPAPASPSASVQDAPPLSQQNGDDIWSTVVEELQHSKPIAAGYTLKARFVSMDGSAFTVGLPREEDHARDALLRERMRVAIEDLLRKSTGEKLSLRVELRDDIEAPPLEVEEEENLPADSRAPNAESSPPEAPVAAEDADAGANASPSPDASGDDAFHNDPLIQDALRIFEAEIK